MKIPRRLISALVSVSWALLLAILASTLGFAPPAAAGDPTYSFNLVGPNTTKALSGPFAGDTLELTGSGAFDPTAGTVVASGSFTHSMASGTVVAKGTWQATAFVSFTAFGGPNPGLQGGTLAITVTFFPEGGAPVTGLPMTVTCLINKPTGFTGKEGVTVGDFTKITRGATLFHLNE